MDAYTYRKPLQNAGGDRVSVEKPVGAGEVFCQYDDLGRLVQCVARVAAISETRVYQDVGPIGTGEEGKAIV